MSKSRREQQLDKTRWVEWVFYVLAVSLTFHIIQTDAPLPALALAFGVMVLGGSAIQLWQFLAQDELGRLRIVKSWAVTGVTMTTLLLTLIVWAAFHYVMSAQRPSVLALTIPFWPVYWLVILSGFLPGLANRYFRWQDERA